MKLIEPHLGHMDMNSGKNIDVMMVLELPAEGTRRVVNARFPLRSKDLDRPDVWRSDQSCVTRSSLADKGMEL